MKTTPSKKVLLNVSLFLLLFLASPFMAQLATWSPAGLSNYGPSPWAPATSNASLTVGGLTRGAGISTVSTGPAAANAWGGLAWQGASDQDATFTITANPGCSVSYSVLNLSYRRSSTGPTLGTLEYTFGNSTTYTVISTINNFTSTATTGVTITPVVLSTFSDLQNVPAGTVVKFRIFPTAATTTIGTWYISGTAGMSLIGTVNPLGYNAYISQTAPVVCNGMATAALNASASNGTAPYTYSWAPTGGTSSSATGLAAGVYSCFVTDATSSVTVGTYTITEPTAITPVISAQTSITCHGGANGSVTVSTSGGHAPYTYSWSPVSGTTASASNLTAGIYTLTITDANTCTATKTVSISEPAAIAPSVLQTNITCYGGSNGSATVTANGGTPAYTYSWSAPGGTTTTVSNLTPGNYTVTVTDSHTCTAQQTVSITQPPVVVVSAGVTNSVICIGSSVTLSGAGADTYTWSGNVQDGVPFSPSATANYTVSGASVNGCSGGSAVVSVTVNALPTVTVTTNKPMICRNNTVALTASGATTYSWTNGVTTAVNTLTLSNTTSYTVTGTDDNSCSNSASFTQSISACTGISSFNSEEESLLVMPNPNNGTFVLKASSAITLAIINELGQLVQSLQLNEDNNYELQVNNLDTGIYFIRGTATTLSVKQKVIVTK